MSASAPNTPAVIVPELRKYQLTQLPKDLEHLKRGANHLKVIAWFIFIPASFFTFITFLFLLMQPKLPGNQNFFVIMLLFVGVACFYFSVSNYIRRARRWAVYVAIVVALLPIFLSIPLLLSPQLGIHKQNPLTLVIEMLYLIGHIKMIRDLIVCLGAVDRIHWAANMRFAHEKVLAEEKRDRWQTT
ncbi:MAG: hypothetical protein QM703_00365 [Gemmatales bacterium]